MKKKNKIRNELNKTSFQTQLFIIVLFSLISCVLLDYVVIQYSFKSRYIKKEVENSINVLDDLLVDINEETELISSFEQFNQETNCIPLLMSSKTGSYILSDSVYSSYKITILENSKSYIVYLNDYSINVSIGDSVSGYLKESTVNNEYAIKSLTINGIEVIDGLYKDSYIQVTNGIVTNVSKPTNLNFIYSNNISVEKGLDIINTKLDSMEKLLIKGTAYSSYYVDIDNGNIFFLIQPDIYKDTSDFIMVISTFVETNELLNIVSSYYGYILIVTVFVAVLIALFISHAFSKPIVRIEKEITKLADSDYSTSSHEFRNRELISLQDTINEVKIDTKEKVKSIEKQKQFLEELNGELLKEEELRSSFIARLSHELKTPLMVISATTEALMSNLIKEEEKEEEYNTILNEVDKTTGIIKDIISTYKTSSKDVKLKVERFNITKSINDIVNTLIPIARENKLVVNLNLEKEEFIDADKTLIEQVVSNFVTNAFKYTRENEKVEISIIDNLDDFIFEVKNYGSHIKESNLNKIWLPFFREDENIDKTSTGMGLYIVKEILQAHKYEFNVTNFDGGVLSYFKVKK